MDCINKKSIIASLALHAAVFAIILLGGAISGCRMKNQPLEIVEFTIAVDPVEEEAEESLPKEPQVKEIKTPPPKPDDIAPPTPPKPKKPKPRNKEIKKGKRVEKKVNPPSRIKPKEKQTLSDAEIRKLLDKGARIGERTSLPKNEISLNASILKNRFYDAWMPPPREASGYRPAVVIFKINRDGSLHSARITQSSGSKEYDESCLEAIRSVGRVSDLSSQFIKEFGKGCEFEFKQKE